MSTQHDTSTIATAAELGNVRPWPELLEAIRPHSADELARLKSSLEQHGQQHPVLVIPDGRIVDGLHRFQLLGNDARVQMLNLPDDEALALGITLNTARRQLTSAQLRKIDAHYKAAILRLRESGKSQTEVAQTLGVAQSTVSTTERKARAERASTSGAEPVKSPDLRVSITPAQRRRALKLVNEGKSQRKAAEAAGISLGSVQRLLREQRDAETKAAESVELSGPKRLDVELADKPREIGRRLHEALMSAKLSPVEIGSQLLRSAADEASDATALIDPLRKALTPSQWRAFCAALVTVSVADDLLKPETSES